LDQRRAPFGRVFNDRIDIGAVESQPVPAAAIGDYNEDGVVGAADCVVWRNAQGIDVTPWTGADGNGDGVVNTRDYDVWRSHFGQTVPVAGDMVTAAAAMLHALDEPNAPTTSPAKLNSPADGEFPPASGRADALAELDPKLLIFDAGQQIRRSKQTVLPVDQFVVNAHVDPLLLTRLAMAQFEQRSTEHFASIGTSEFTTETREYFRDVLDLALAGLQPATGW
jgi:hypothetical protein